MKFAHEVLHALGWLTAAILTTGLLYYLMRGA